jgi:flagellar hook-associated protein 3 FlgL
MIPPAAAHATRHQSYLTRLERFSDNIQNSINHYQVAEGHMRHSVDILQEIRQLAVQGGNGTYSRDDLIAMGNQVDELLREFINTANATDAEGLSIFLREPNPEPALPGYRRSLPWRRGESGHQCGVYR